MSIREPVRIKEQVIAVVKNQKTGKTKTFTTDKPTFWGKLKRVFN